MSFSYFRLDSGKRARASSHGFGRVPDPPEPPSDEWFEEHCPRCKYNHEWEEDGKWFAECTQGGCTGFVEREEEAKP